MLSQPRFPSIAICVLFCISVTNPKPGNAQGFLTPVTYPLDIVPSAVIAADLNHDTFCDVVMPNETSSSFTVRLANANGTLQSPQHYPLDSATLGAAVADLNMDGNPDIAAGTAYGITIYTGDGLGDFTLHSTIPGIYAICPITTGDFNKDGFPDISAGTYVDGPMHILLNNGDGTFQSPVPYSAFATGRRLTDLICTHMDNDNNLDIVGCYNGYDPSTIIVVFKGNGDGTFQTSPLSASPGGQPSNVVTGCFGNNTTTETLTVSPWSSGDIVSIDFATLPPTVTPDAYGGNSGYDICTADFNGDSAADIAVAGMTDTIIKINDPVSLGNFQDMFFPTGLSESIQFIDTGDFNGDGKPDVVSINYNAQTLSILINDYPTDSSIAGWALY